jgi:adenylate kinase family enzyme
VKRVAVITSASGNGGTVFSRELAARLGVPFHELDALFWRPGWTETPADEFRALVEPIVATDAWVIDGKYYGKLGDLVLRNADLVVWLDLPMYVWLPRLLRRTLRRAATREELWNGNRESFRNALLSRNSLLLFTLRWYRSRLRRYPERLAVLPHVRLRTKAEVERFLSSATRATGARRSTRPL